MFYNKKSKNRELTALSKSQAVIYFSIDGNIEDANDNFLDLLEYSLDEIKGKHHSMFVEAGYRKSEEYKTFWKNLNRGEFQKSQFKRLGKGGKEVWIEASYNPLFDKNGKVDRIVKYATDISSTKMEQANFEGQLAAISISQAVIEFDLKGNILTANKNFLDTLGYTLEEIKGKHHSMFVEAKYRESEEYNIFWRNLNAGEYSSGEYLRLGKNNKEIWIQASYNPIMDMNGNPFKVVKYATDITQQKLANSNFQGQIDAIHKVQAVIEFELDGTIIDANQNFLGVVEYSLNEIVGKHHRIFVDSDEANSPDYTIFWEELRAGKFQSKAYKRITKTGKEVWIQASYNPIFNASGVPYKVVKFATEITEVINAGNLANDTADNVQGVAAAVEEMSSSIKEISQNMAISSDAARGILDASNLTSISTDELVASMKSMENVVELINNIASQVNLLALNATIEAARAGSAGKGFAVVASEVKNLANQTTKATEEISSSIIGVQKIAEDVAEKVHSIKSTAEGVTETFVNISSAVEEQSTVTNEISENTQKMAVSMSTIANKIQSLSNAA